MKNRRILYVLHPFSFPAGGVALIYRHVEILAAHGMPAFVALPQKPEVDFYASSAPLLIHGGNMQTQAGDVCVIPEGFSDSVRALMGTPAKRLMFCQNQYYLPLSANPGPGIAELGVHGVIASSEAVQKFFRDVYGTEVPIIPCAIDPARYFPAKEKRRQIVFMPRKLADEAAYIAATFKRRHPRFADVPWVPIDGVTQAVAARMMSESAVFLSLSHKESLGLPPLEAMACGCFSAGYHGDGGREYMNPENGWWAETGDWKACVDGLAAALDLFDKDGAEADTRRKMMAQTVERYNPRRLESELIAFWRRELAVPFQ
jgi:hypothetical protein